MTKDEAMKLALEALKDNQHLVADNERHAYVMEYNAIIEKLEEALAKQEQRSDSEQLGEPDDLMIAYMSGLHDGKKLDKKEQGEPVAVMELYTDGWDLVENIDTDWLETLPFGTKLYTTPQQRKPLTDEQIYAAIRPLCTSDQIANNLIDIGIDEYRAIEAAHGIKE